MSVEETAEYKLETLALIEEHGLTVRQIPRATTSRYRYREDQPMLKGGVRNGEFYTVTKYPEHGGKWMANYCPHSMTQYHWNLERDHLSDTLGEAVRKAIKEKNDE